MLSLFILLQYNRKLSKLFKMINEFFKTICIFAPTVKSLLLGNFINLEKRFWENKQINENNLCILKWIQKIHREFQTGYLTHVHYFRKAALQY